MFCLIFLHIFNGSTLESLFIYISNFIKKADLQKYWGSTGKQIGEETDNNKKDYKEWGRNYDDKNN